MPRSIASATSTATNVNALMTNTQPEPTSTMRKPATAGPIMRAALNEAELSATAFDMFEPDTRSATNVWRAGVSTAFTRPRASAKP